jgi:hypothetical protein
VGVSAGNRRLYPENVKTELILILAVLIGKTTGKSIAANVPPDYLGQPPPGETPQVFARGIVSTDNQEHGAPAFSPDGNEMFWQLNRRDNEKKWHVSVMTMRRFGGIWTAPEGTSYGSVPVFSVDGMRLYFESSRSIANGKVDGPYYIEKQGNGWGEPACVGLLARFQKLQFVDNVSIARNGTLYFLGHAAGLKNDCGIYRTELTNGEYAIPELLPPSINDPAGLNWTPFIAPDESYLIFSSSRGRPAQDHGDLYVCFRRLDGSWMAAVSLGESVNTNWTERFPVVSPDGMYLFFTRDTPDHDDDVFWVSASIIEKLKGNAVQEETNQKLRPTPASGPPAADAPVAPATGAAHL